MATQPVPVVPKAASPALDTEPAVAIGEEYAGKSKVSMALAALFGLAAIYGVNVAPGVADYVATLVHILVPVGIAAFAGWKARRLAQQQAAETREAVYAPATTRALVHAAAASTPVVNGRQGRSR